MEGNDHDVEQHITMLGRVGLLYGSGRNLWELTWEGFNLLDAIRDESVWSKAKGTLMKEGMSWTYRSIEIG